MNSTYRHLETSKGKSVDTLLEDPEALVLLLVEGSTFAKDLYAKADRYGLSHDQLVWAHVLAMKVINTTKSKHKDESPESNSTSHVYEKISGYLKSAINSGLSKPKLRLIVFIPGTSKTSATVTLALLSDGAVRITDKNKKQWSDRFGCEMPIYYGKLTATSDKLIGQNLDGLWEALVALAENPEETAAMYGHITGSCCFCSRMLTDKRSTDVGYGPICASKFGLAWGDK